MADEVTCTLCGHPAKRSVVEGATWHRYECQDCVTYIATLGALHWIALSDQVTRDKLSIKARSAPSNSILLLSDEHVWLNTQETQQVYSEYVAMSSAE